jgi:DNA-binding response OmpR family regulator
MPSCRLFGTRRSLPLGTVAPCQNKSAPLRSSWGPGGRTLYGVGFLTEMVGPMSDRPLILIVDDEHMIQNALRRACARTGFASLAVLDGARAFELALSKAPDLILLDIHITTADGRDILRALKGNETTATIPVFIHSGCRAQEDRLAALELGADDYFEKGYDLTLLFRRVAYTLSLVSSGTYSTGPAILTKNSGERR